MPYIESGKREDVEKNGASSAGELNYLITRLLVSYLDKNGVSYQTFNDCLGALEGAKLELYRRRVVDYEEVKISYNGDVYR